MYTTRINAALQTLVKTKRHCTKSNITMASMTATSLLRRW